MLTYGNNGDAYKEKKYAIVIVAISVRKTNSLKIFFLVFKTITIKLLICGVCGKAQPHFPEKGETGAYLNGYIDSILPFCDNSDGQSYQ